MCPQSLSTKTRLSLRDTTVQQYIQYIFLILKLYHFSAFPVVKKRQLVTMLSLALICCLLVCPPGSLLARAECVIDPDSSGTWPRWPPILTDQAGDFILPRGEDNNRHISLAEDTVSSEQQYWRSWSLFRLSYSPVDVMEHLIMITAGKRDLFLRGKHQEMLKTHS